MIMLRKFTRVLVTLTLSLSIITLAQTWSFHIGPSPVRGDTAPVPGTAGAQWAPAGPMVDKIAISIFASADPAEFTALRTNTIDLTDSPLTNIAPNFWVNTFTPAGTGVYVTPPAATGQWGYRVGWTDVAQDVVTGIPSFFSLLNMWNPAPTTVGTIRWGFSAGTTTLNPFSFTTLQEGLVVHEIYDSLVRSNPYNTAQQFGWMANQWQFLPPQPGDPPNTMGDIKFNIRNDVFFHDGIQVTASDFKFSVLGYQAIPGSQSGLVAHVIDVQIPNPFNFLVNLDVVPTAADVASVGSALLLPQHIWALDTINRCIVKGTLPCTVKAGAGALDPVLGYLLIGSGPYECRDVITNVVGGNCSSTGTSTVAPGGMISLTRDGFGQAGTANSAYFRDSAKYKQWQWSDIFAHGVVDILDVSSAAGCLGSPAAGNCAHWDTPAATITCVAPAGSCNAGSLAGLGGNNAGTVSFIEIQQAFRWFSVTWTSPLAYTVLIDAQPIPQTLYEGGVQYA